MYACTHSISSGANITSLGTYITTLVIATRWGILVPATILLILACQDRVPARITSTLASDPNVGEEAMCLVSWLGLRRQFKRSPFDTSNL